MDLKDYFRNCYSKEVGKMSGINNIKVDKIVFATQESALKWFDEYYEKHENGILEYVRNKHNQLRITMNDDTRIISAPINDSSRGYRYKSVVLDYMNIPLKVFNLVILPCGYACSRNNVDFIEDIGY